MRLYELFWTILDQRLKARSHSALWLNNRQNPSKLVSREADDGVRVDVEFKTKQDAGENRNGVGRSKKLWTAQNFIPRTTPAAHVVKTCNTRDNPRSDSD